MVIFVIASSRFKEGKFIYISPKTLAIEKIWFSVRLLVLNTTTATTIEKTAFIGFSVVVSVLITQEYDEYESELYYNLLKFSSFFTP
jgi:hypothetical protein